VLREYKDLKQEAGPGSRRWFESDGLDLVVWLDAAGVLTGFQLCYDFGRGEHALTWRRESGCAHHRVDGGDASPLSNQSPVLVPDGLIPWGELGLLFDQRSATLEPGLREAVRRVLAGGR
jgi:hypothetical protein